MRTIPQETGKHCAYCGHPITDTGEPAPERFGERFCSATHAEQFVAGVRAARMEAAARSEPSASETREGRACALPVQGQRGWRDYLKRAACWGAPLLLILAIPLMWTGGWAAAGGSALSVLALLACPLGMYFMMRAMGTQHGDHGGKPPDGGAKSHQGDGRKP